MIVDHATRYIIAKTTTSLSATITLQILKDKWIHYFGIPHIILTDGGTAFKKFFTKILQEFVTVAYRPEGNGINERAHRCLRTMVKAITHEYSIKLSEDVNLVVEAYNNTPHVALTVSPYELCSEGH